MGNGSVLTGTVLTRFPVALYLAIYGIKLYKLFSSIILVLVYIINIIYLLNV